MNNLSDQLFESYFGKKANSIKPNRALGEQLFENYFNKKADLTIIGDPQTPEKVITEPVSGPKNPKKTLNDLMRAMESISNKASVQAEKDSILQDISYFKKDLEDSGMGYYSKTPAQIVARWLPSIISNLKLIIPHIQDQDANIEDRTSNFMTGIGLVNQLEHVLKGS
jgi:hypothetical protein